MSLHEPGDHFQDLIENLHEVVFTLDLQGHFSYINPAIEKLTGYQVDDLIGHSYKRLIHPDELPDLIARFKNALKGEPEPYEFRIVDRGGNILFVHTSSRLIREGGKTVGLTGVMVNITKQKQAEMELRQRAEELAAFQANALDLAVQQDLLSLLRTIVERSMSLLKAPKGFIYLYDGSSNDLELTIELGNPVTPGIRLKMGEGMAGWVAQNRQTLIVDDYSTWEGRAPVFHNIPYHAVIEVPMLFGGQLIGVLGANDSEGTGCKFTEKDARVLLLFAGQAASAVHDVKLVQGLQMELAERNRVEDSLREAEARYRTLVEQIPAIVYTDSAEKIGLSHYISPQIKTLLGFDPEEWSLNNELWTKAIHPDDRERVLAEYDRTFETGDPFISEYRMTAKTGRMVWIRDEAVLIKDQSGRSLFWQGIMHDITERKLVAEALRESELRFRSLVEQSSDGIVMVDKRGLIISWNQGQEQLSGFKKAEVLGQPMWDVQLKMTPDELKTPAMLNRFRDNIQTLLARGESQRLEHPTETIIQLPDGTRHVVELVIFKIKTDKGFMAGSISRDITERKRAQALQDAVFRIAIAAETTKSLNDLYPQIHEIISSVMPAENFYITLFDEERDVLRFPYFKDAQDEPYLGEIQPGDGLTAYVLRTGRSLLCTQAIHDELERQGEVKLLGVPSAIWLGVPLIIEGKTIGAMVVQHYSDPQAYGEREQHMLEFVSSQVAIAISRKQAEDDLRDRHRLAETLRQVAQVVTASLDVKEVVQLMLVQLKKLFAYDTASVLIIGESGRPDLMSGMYYSKVKKTSQATNKLLMESPILKQMTQDLQPVNIPDVRQHPGWIWISGAKRVRSFLAVPLIAQKRMIGVLMADSHTPAFFSDNEVSVAQLLAQQMAIALENARLYEAEQRRLQESETLREAAAVVASTLNQDQAVHLILVQLARVVPYDSASVLIMREGYLEIVGGQGWEDPSAVIGLHFPIPGNNPNTLVVQQRAPVILGNAPQEYPDFLRKPHAHILSWLGVPMIIRDRVIGILAIDSKKPDHFSQESVRLVSAFASQAATTIENARLYKEAIQAAERRAILHRASQEIAHAYQDPEQVYMAVHRAAVQLMPAEAFVITLVDEQSQESIGVYLVDKGGRSPVDRAPAGVGLSGVVISTGKPMITNDLLTDPIPGSVHFGEEEEVRSILAVPMRLGEKVIGMLSAQSYKPHVYTEEDQALMEMLAAHASVAIENTRLYAETLRRLNELESVNRISTALRAAQTIDDMLPILLDETLQVLGTSAGAIWLFDPLSGLLIEKVARGWFETIQEMPIKPGEGIAGTVFKTGQASVSTEFFTDPLTLKNTREKLPAGWGGACIPIRTVRETIGVLFVSVELPRQLQEDAVSLLVTLSEMAGNAIRRADLHEQTEHQLQRLASLRAVDMAINTILDLRVTLGILIDHIISQLKVDAVNILLINPNTQTLYHAASSGFRTESLKYTRLYLGDSLAGQAIRTRATIHIPDLGESKLVKRGQLSSEEGFVSYYGIPLIAKGQVKGVLEIFHRSPMRPDSDWRNFLETLSGQAAIAIDNSVLFEELQQTNLNLSLAYDATIEGWSRALDLRDKETEGHTQRVTEITVHLAEIMSVNASDLVHIRRGALLHDIGKMGVPDSILYKTGPLTEEEWAIMHRHPEFAFEMLSPISYLRQALDIPYGHHERWDGSGYPRHFAGEQIPLAARIFAVVDVWDALISDRPYRKAWKKDAAVDFVRKNSGKLFDPRVVETFMRMLENDQIR